MKTKITAIILTLIAGVAYAATDRQDLDDFDRVVFALPYEVDFVVADEPFVTFEGDEDAIQDIIVEQKGDTLKLRREEKWFGWSDSKGDVVVTIGYQELEAITMAGSGDGHAELLEGDELKLSITGSANIEVDKVAANEVDISIAGAGNVEIHDLSADSISSKIAGSGDIELSGRVVTQKISIAGSGDHQAGELRTQETTASIRGSGDIAVWAEARLSANVAGSGDIEYYGDPELEERIYGSGDLVRIGSSP